MAEKVEVVIKIPKYYLTHPQDYTCLAECVRRGTILPEHHEDLIERRCGNKVCNGCEHSDICDTYNALTIIERSDSE